MGMYLMRQASGDSLPAFMTFLSWNELPWYWAGTQHFLWALCLVVLVPGALASPSATSPSARGSAACTSRS